MDCARDLAGERICVASNGATKTRLSHFPVAHENHLELHGRRRSAAIQLGKVTRDGGDALFCDCDGGFLEGISARCRNQIIFEGGDESREFCEVAVASIQTRKIRAMFRHLHDRLIGQLCAKLN